MLTQEQREGIIAGLSDDQIVELCRIVAVFETEQVRVNEALRLGWEPFDSLCNQLRSWTDVRLVRVNHCHQRANINMCGAGELREEIK